MTPADLERYREMKREAEEVRDSLLEHYPYSNYFIPSELMIEAFESRHPDIRPLTAPVDYVVTTADGCRSYYRGRVVLANMRATAGALMAEHDEWESATAPGAKEFRARLRAAAAILLAPWNGWEPGKVR